MEQFDYIVIGAGFAGCVIANRLGEDPRKKILVLEAGGSDRSLTISMPAALSVPMNSKRFNWGLKTEPEPGLDNRIMNLPRGKGLGGSSSINGMCYVRGNPMDYELWSAKGALGWHWANVLPYFKKLEKVSENSDLRGNEGPITVTKGNSGNILNLKLKQSGSAILSTEELDISLSFQSTIFSKPLNVYPLTILARPVILSLPIGFFL